VIVQSGGDWIFTLSEADVKGSKGVSPRMEACSVTRCIVCHFFYTLWCQARTSPTDYPLVSADHFFDLPCYHQHDFIARQSKISNTLLLYKAADKDDYGRELWDRMIVFHLLLCKTGRRGETEDDLRKTKRERSEDGEEGRSSPARRADRDPTSATLNDLPPLVE